MLTFIPQGCHLPPADGELEISFLHGGLLAVPATGDDPFVRMSICSGLCLVLKKKLL
jgi:hypothetical protein